MKRRDLLKQLPAVAVLPALAAVPALATPETPIMRLFREWERIRRLKLADMPDADYDVLLDQQIAIEDEIIQLPAQNAADWIAKVTAYSCLGEGGLMDHNESPALWAEARALVAA